MFSSPIARPRLSLAVIIANDLPGLEQTLSSVHDIVDEIVICDTGDRSSAHTVAGSYHARVIQQPWCDSFSVARHECLRHVQGDWVLWLDGGETIDQQDREGLRQFIDTKACPDKAYLMLVKRPPAPGTVGGEQIARRRLIPAHPQVRFEGRVRESLDASLAALQITDEGLPFRILRGDQEHDEDRKAMRARRNIELADLEMREGGPKPRLLNCLGEAFQTLGEFQQARSFFQQAVETSPRQSADLLEAYYGLLTADERPGDLEAKTETGLKALEHFPLDMQLLCAMGGYLQASGQWDLALRSYETAYRFGQVHPQVWHLDHVHALAAECYALCLQQRQCDAQACDVLEAALSSYPTMPRLRRHLLDNYIRLNRREAALQLVRTLPLPASSQENLLNAVRGACLATEQQWPAAKNYLRVAYDAGCRDPLCLRWLGLALLKTGDPETAHARFQEWAELEPGRPEPQRYLASMQEGLAVAGS